MLITISKEQGQNTNKTLKIVFNDAETKWQFIKKASSLRNSEEFKKVGLSLDKTTKERQEDMALRAKLLEEKKTAHPNEVELKVNPKKSDKKKTEKKPFVHYVPLSS